MLITSEKGPGEMEPIAVQIRRPTHPATPRRRWDLKMPIIRAVPSVGFGALVPQFLCLGLAAILISAAAAGDTVGSTAELANPFAWPAPTRIARPWARWWWLGSAVDGADLERLLAEYHRAGLGGVEICPIYGAKGYESRFIDYLSPKWMDMLAVTTQSAARLDMGVDMTTGTGWPMGGPWVPSEQASESVSLRRYLPDANGKISESVILAPPEASGGASQRGASLDGIRARSPARLRLLCLKAVGRDGSQIDLTERVRDGRLDWAAPGAGWILYALTARQPVQRVKRAAPGGSGSVVDPYSVKALDTYLSRFDLAFQSFGGAMPRAQFHDSFEYYGANWTLDFFGEFSRRRGYDLREHLPELDGDGVADAASRVREDYRQTIGELHLAYIERWTAWSHGHGSLTREQAHGAPANIEDVYAAADIPETEGSFGAGTDDQVPMLKFASSAAHVTGRTLASSETFTWLGEHFQVALSQLKAVADTFFLSGTNHIVLHGIPYSPADAAWPGWLFYASVNFGPNGGLWHDLPAFNAYITRCQSILQSGKPDNDVLLYFPVADFWQQVRTLPGPAGPLPGRETDPLVEQFTTPGKWMLGTPFHDAAMELWHRGIGFDEVTDALLEGAHADRAASSRRAGGFGISLGGNRYRAIVVPPCRTMPVETFRHLLNLAREGASIIFSGDLPSDVPGLSELDARRAELRGLLDAIPLETPRRGVGNAEKRPGDATVPMLGRSARMGAGLILSGRGSPNPGGLSSLLDLAGIPRERMTDEGLNCIRRRNASGYDYLIVNTGGRPVEKWITLARDAASAVLLDPLYSDRSGIAAMRPGTDGAAIFLQIAPGQSLVLRTFDTIRTLGPTWSYLRPEQNDAVALTGDWSVHFIEGGPALPRDFQAPRLASWTEQEDPEAKRFAGTAVYRVRFALLKDPRLASAWRLDLGRVAESARVRLNGREVATLWCAPFSTEVGRFLLQGDNLLEVEVTNVAANRIRDLDRRHVDWKSFYEINFVNRDYGPFDASGWPLRASGLLGPVLLTPMAAISPKSEGR
jgi:hypothetical protein